MKRWILIWFMVLPFLFTACGSNGGGPPPVYTWYSSDTPILIPDQDFIFSDILVTEGPFFISRVSVTVVILHTSVSDLDLILWSPDGTPIYLTDNSSDGEDFWYTTFDESAIVGIWQTTSLDDPRTGYYLPVESLDWFYGESAVGIWTLEVDDQVVLDNGYLIEWSIDIQ